MGQDPRWGGREIADKTGYVPKGLMAVPLIHEEEAVGVLNVLDRPQESRFSLEEMELLGLFGNRRSRSICSKIEACAKAVRERDSDSALLARVAENLDALDGQRRAAGVELLRSLEALFKH